MLTSRCAFCGAPAENPVQFAWVITEDDGDTQSGSMPLCLECGQSWCHHTVTCPVPCLETDQP